MPSELRPLVRSCGLQRRGSTFAGAVGRHQVVAGLMGVGMAGATRAAERLLADDDVERIVVVGIAGGLHPELPIGHVVVPEEVVDGVTGAEYPTVPWGGTEPSGRLVTFDDLQSGAERIADLHRQGFLAIDMETAAVAAVCERRGRELTVFRAISDRGDIDTAVAAMARPDGSPDVGAAVRYMLRRPWRTPYLVTLGRDATKAARAAATAALAALTSEP
jgi:uridine phosphorylase